MQAYKRILQLTTALLLINTTTFAMEAYGGLTYEEQMMIAKALSDADDAAVPFPRIQEQQPHPIAPTQQVAPHLFDAKPVAPVLKTQAANQEDFEKLVRYILNSRDVIFSRLCALPEGKLHFLEMVFCMMPDSLILPVNPLDDIKKDIEKQLENYCNDFCFNYELALQLQKYVFITCLDYEEALQPFLKTYHNLQESISKNLATIQALQASMTANFNPDAESNLDKKFQDIGAKQLYTQLKLDCLLISGGNRPKLPPLIDFLSTARQMVDVSQLKVEKKVVLPVVAIAPERKLERKDEPKVNLRPKLDPAFQLLIDKSNQAIESRQTKKGSETVMSYGRELAPEFYVQFSNRLQELLGALNPTHMNLQGIKEVAQLATVQNEPGMQELRGVVETEFDAINKKSHFPVAKPKFDDHQILKEIYTVKQILDFYEKVSGKLEHKWAQQDSIRKTLVLSLLRHVVPTWRQDNILQSKQTAHNYLTMVANDVMRTHQLFEHTNSELANKVIFDFFMYLLDQDQNCQVGMCGRMYLVQHNTFSALMDLYLKPL